VILLSSLHFLWFATGKEGGSPLTRAPAGFFFYHTGKIFSTCQNSLHYQAVVFKYTHLSMCIRMVYCVPIVPLSFMSRLSPFSSYNRVSSFLTLITMVVMLTLILLIL
jgi:hypothetical protein